MSQHKKAVRGGDPAARLLLPKNNVPDLISFRNNLTVSSGVYLFMDKSGRVIYVGKAKNLKKRILSYFKTQSSLSYKTAMMMNKAEKLDFILTDTENEAFILESNLIKKHLPRYNIILRDDKQYPCLRLDIRHPFPQLKIVRKIKKDEALYFGPFSSGNSVRSTLKLIDRTFQLRKCKSSRLPKRSRPCLNYQLGRCLGVCTNNISSDAYGEITAQVRLFLEGRNRELIKRLEKKMGLASDQLDFEKAAGIRDQIMAVEKIIERQDVVSPKMKDKDIIGLVRGEGVFQIANLFVRKGCLLGSRYHGFKDQGESKTDIMTAFLKQYYSQGVFIPDYILISEPIEGIISIKKWVSELAKKKISIHHPLKGENLRLVRMALSNAENMLSCRAESYDVKLPELVREVLKLEKRPVFIEGLDISNLHGDQAVGTIVSFKDGKAHKSGYRNYRIKNVDGIDDYGMMSELVFRRLKRGNIPDLFVVDGGKGHLMAVKRSMDNIPGIKTPEVVSIAKKDKTRGGGKADKIYLPGRKNPLSIKADHPVFLFLMRIRDEAHRRAVTYHRKLRAKKIDTSLLDQIPGIGPKKKRLLLKQLGNIDAISSLKLEDLVLVPGIDQNLAKNVINFFKNEVKKTDHYRISVDIRK